MHLNLTFNSLYIFVTHNHFQVALDNAHRIKIKEREMLLMLKRKRIRVGLNHLKNNSLTN